MTLDITDSLQSFVDSESSQHGFVSGNDSVPDLVQKERDWSHGRVLIKELVQASPRRLFPEAVSSQR